jgi:hypothetical protein
MPAFLWPAAIARVEYHPHLRELHIWLLRDLDNYYIYSDVPAFVYEQLLETPYEEQFFDDLIRSNHSEKCIVASRCGRSPVDQAWVEQGQGEPSVDPKRPRGKDSALRLDILVTSIRAAVQAFRRRPQQTPHTFQDLTHPK